MPPPPRVYKNLFTVVLEIEGPTFLFSLSDHQYDSCLLVIFLLSPGPLIAALSFSLYYQTLLFYLGAVHILLYQ